MCLGQLVPDFDVRRLRCLRARAEKHASNSKPARSASSFLFPSFWRKAAKAAVAAAAAAVPSTAGVCGAAVAPTVALSMALRTSRLAAPESVAGANSNYSNFAPSKSLTECAFCVAKAVTIPSIHSPE